uniref:ATXN7 n=1 Tax=Steinernema glaseri TaxID=37863 RepID=A0A1I7YQ03_9BILA
MPRRNPSSRISVTSPTRAQLPHKSHMITEPHSLRDELPKALASQLHPLSSPAARKEEGGVPHPPGLT